MSQRDAEVAAHHQPVSKPSEIPFEQLRLTQDFAAHLGITEKQLALVRKPGKDWFRVHASEEFRGPFCVIEKPGDRDTDLYLVNRDVARCLEGDTKLKLLALCVTTFHEPFLWPVPLATDGRKSGWHLSAEQALVQATTHWTRLVADRSSYRILRAPDDGPIAQLEPRFPVQTFREIVTTAFAGRYIATMDHPVVKALLGR